MTLETISSPENKFRAGQKIRMPLMEGLDEMETWMVAKIEGDKVHLVSMSVENPGGEPIGTLDDKPVDETVSIQSKITTLQELGKYN